MEWRPTNTKEEGSDGNGHGWCKTACEQRQHTSAEDKFFSHRRRDVVSHVLPEQPILAGEKLPHVTHWKSEFSKERKLYLSQESGCIQVLPIVL